MNEGSLKTASLLDSKNGGSEKERIHHPYSPSTLHNLECCPCFRNRQTDKLHHRTVAGTRAHSSVESGEDDQRLGDDDAVAVAECLDFVAQRRALMEASGPVQELKEEYLPIDDYEFEDCKATTAGYADHILINHDQTYAEGIDYKFGYWPVADAQENPQCIAYTLGIFKRFPTMQKVCFFFKQPHIGLVSSATFTRDQVPQLFLRISVTVARAREARKMGTFDMASPHVPVCQFCGELGRCDKVMEFACIVGHKFHPVEIPEDITPTGIKSPEQTTLALRLVAVLKVWCDAFRRQVTDRIIRGDAPLPPGQRIQTLAKREIVDLAKLRTVALRYLTQAEYESTLETTFGALEALISEKAPRGQKTNVLKEFQQALKDAGAVKVGESISFLRAVAEKKN